jgi:hypothetical protein
LEKVPPWLGLDLVLGYFGRETRISRQRYRDFVESMVGKEYESPLARVVASTILGGKGFVSQISDKYLSGKKVDRNLPALRELSKISLAEVAEKVGKEFRRDSGLAKKAAIYVCHRYSGRSLKEIGEFFKVGESGVTQASRRFREMMDKDANVRKKIDKVRKSLNLSNV